MHDRIVGKMLTIILSRAAYRMSLVVYAQLSRCLVIGQSGRPEFQINRISQYICMYIPPESSRLAALDLMSNVSCLRLSSPSRKLLGELALVTWPVLMLALWRRVGDVYIVLRS